MVERSCRNCKYCGKSVNEDYNFTLDHTTGIYGEDKDPTIVREGVFCSRSCLIRWLLDPEAGEGKAGIGTSGRDALGLIFEISHGLDQISMGVYNDAIALVAIDQDDAWRELERGRAAALIEIGLGDARRDLEELRNLIVKPEASEEKEYSG